MAQANAILDRRGAAQRRRCCTRGPSLPALRALDAIHDRLELPADRLLRHAGARSSYLVLPIFALANAGVALAPGVLEGRGPLVARDRGRARRSASRSGMVALLGARGAARARGEARRLLLAPARRRAGASAGIGFTMSLFIAGQAFAEAGDFAAAKIAVFAASIVAALIGSAILWSARAPETAAE